MSTPPGPAGPALPPPPSTSFPKGGSATRRRPAMIGLAVLLIVGGAAVAGLLAVRIDSREPVLVASHAIAVGQPITADDLAVQRVAGDGLSVLPATTANSLIGSFASQNIPQGRLLDQQMFTSQGFLRKGVVAVGVAIGSGRMPASGLSTGDTVEVVQVVEGKATVLVENAVVSRGPSADASAGGGSFLGGGGSSAGSSNGGIATLIVTPDVAPAVAAASAANQIAVILITRGGS